MESTETKQETKSEFKVRLPPRLQTKLDLQSTTVNIELFPLTRRHCNLCPGGPRNTSNGAERDKISPCLSLFDLCDDGEEVTELLSSTKEFSSRRSRACSVWETPRRRIDPWLGRFTDIMKMQLPSAYVTSDMNMNDRC